MTFVWSPMYVHSHPSSTTIIQAFPRLWAADPVHTNLPCEGLENWIFHLEPPNSTLPRRPSPASAMILTVHTYAFEGVPQPVEARILENAPRGAREREFSFWVPPGGSKSKARPGTPISVQLANLPSPSAGQQQQEAPQLWVKGGDLTKKT